MLAFIITASLLLATIGAASPFDLWERTVENGQCKGANNTSGVCVSTSSCTAAGGAYISNACPDQPEDIKCCVKPACGSGGSCQWTSQCASKKTVPDLCPGPADYNCCLPNTADSGDDNKADSNDAPKDAAKDDSLGDKILAKAKTAEGLPYVWGGGSCDGPIGGGYDCSGLVSWAVCQVTGRDLFKEGLRVTREAYCAPESKMKYRKVPYANRRAGDAVYFGGACDCANNKASIHHVGLMMNSKTKMFNALKTGTKLRVDDFGSWSEKPCPYVIRYA